MFRTTEDVVEVRRWAEAHGLRPCRDERTGRLVLVPAGQDGCDVGWEEFEPAFLASREVLVYEDGPGRARCFVGPPDEARAYLCGARVDGPAAPR